MNTKKAYLPLLIFILLIPVLVSVSAVKADSSNPLVLSGGVNLYSPVSTTYLTNLLSLNLTFAYGAGMHCKLNYTIDDQFSGPIPLTYNPSASLGFQLITYKKGYVQLPELSNGPHRLVITVEGDLNDYHCANPPGAPFKHTPGTANWVATWVDTVDFSIDSNASTQPPNTPIPTKDTTLPCILNMSVENTTYHTTNIPLNFTVNENITQAVYSLDEAANITIAGNSTLTNLSVGTHNLTVYVWDDTGNVGASQTIAFTVAEASTASQNDSAEPFPIGLVIAALAGFLVGVILLAIVYIKWFKR